MSKEHLQLVLLLTDELKATKPESVQIIDNYGWIAVHFDDYPNMNGDHCILEGSKEDVVKWLAPFKGIARGIGAPICQEFEIVHVNDDSISKYDEPMPKQPKKDFRALEL